MYVKNGELVESEVSEEIYPVKPTYSKNKKNQDTDSDFEDVTDSEEEDPVLSQMKHRRND